jgi:hypothetical protein
MDILARIRRWRFALLVLLCVGGSQLVMAGHQFQHDDVLVAESCAVCIQLDQLDSPVPGTDLLLSIPAPFAGEFTFTDAQHNNGPARFYVGRAPPGSRNTAS